MKVAFYVYPIAFQSPGGGEILLLKTKEYLEKEGVSVTLLNPWTDKLTSFDILHTFGSVKDSLRMMQLAHTLGIKNVLSTICWYSLKSAWGMHGGVKSRSLAVMRHIAKSAFPFLPSQRKMMMECSDLLIPNSQSEANQLKNFFCVSKKKIKVIPNGVDERFGKIGPELFIEKYGLRDFILCVGRIEPRKNQLNVIRALNQIDREVVIIGDFVPAYKTYYDLCRKEAKSHIRFLGGISHDSDLLASAFSACHTFVLATWLETPGLAALEAGLAGANIVITDQGATGEYFQDHAHYVRPDSINAIARGVSESLKRPKSTALKNHIQKEYLWPRVAKVTADAYRTLLNQ